MNYWMLNTIKESICMMLYLSKGGCWTLGACMDVNLFFQCRQPLLVLLFLSLGDFVKTKIEEKYN